MLDVLGGGKGDVNEAPFGGCTEEHHLCGESQTCMDVGNMVFDGWELVEVVDFLLRKLDGFDGAFHGIRQCFVG